MGGRNLKGQKLQKRRREFLTYVRQEYLLSGGEWRPTTITRGRLGQVFQGGKPQVFPTKGLGLKFQGPYDIPEENRTIGFSLLT